MVIFFFKLLYFVFYYLIDISVLPPEMGLLNKLWNLNTRGCNLNEPLKTMIESKKYKTMDVVGYLKSILEKYEYYR